MLHAPVYGLCMSPRAKMSLRYVMHVQELIVVSYDSSYEVRAAVMLVICQVRRSRNVGSCKLGDLRELQRSIK